VTCLCLTRNRREWLPKAIACFLRQTYPSRELLIIADGTNVRDLLPDDPSIRLIEVAGHSDIGTKRNFGCSRANGRVIAHWDDDDYSASQRLLDQVGRMESTGKAVTGYRSMRFTDGRTCWLYSGSPDYALGTSLCYRVEWWRNHQFPSVQVAEDSHFVRLAAAARELSVAPAGELMHATVHGGNTSPRTLQGSNWQMICESEAKCTHRSAA
jgi:O-antigen biosynthesis protein